MLNKDNIRELAYVVKIDDVLPHPNADRLEIAVIGGWHVIVGIGDFKKGDLGIYFEIDSKLPEKEPWTDMGFLASKHFKIKTQKIRGELSQGFVVPPSALGWESGFVSDGHYGVRDENCKYHFIDDESKFLTKELEVTYAVAEDNRRKGNGSDKYKAMTQRNVKFAKTMWWRWLYKRDWGKKLLFFFFGKKRDKKGDWPSWVVKTDEERVENMPWILNAVDSDGTKLWWVATEKVDGTSTTFTMKRGKKTLLGRQPNEFYVCSRNIVFDTPEKLDRCYYDQNYYTQMAEKYNIKEVLDKILKANPEWEWITIQGETFGKGVQKNEYGMSDVDFKAFNVIDSVNGRWNSEEAADYIEYNFNIPFVPILTEIQLPNSIEELREYVRSEKSTIYDGMKEGVVFRTFDGQKSFKCVDPEYIMKYHS